MTENINIIESKKGETENIDNIIIICERLERLSKKSEESQKYLAFAKFKEQVIALIKSQIYFSQDKQNLQLSKKNSPKSKQKLKEIIHIQEKIIITKIIIKIKNLLIKKKEILLVIKKEIINIQILVK